MAPSTEEPDNGPTPTLKAPGSSSLRTKALRLVAWLLLFICTIIALFFWLTGGPYGIDTRDLAEARALQGLQWLLEGIVGCAALLVIAEIADSLTAIRSLLAERK
jgi:hypothetical protein